VTVNTHIIFFGLGVEIDNSKLNNCLTVLTKHKKNSITEKATEFLSGVYKLVLSLFLS
jgi:hypothetical protein